jgi:hypothetical protein
LKITYARERATKNYVRFNPPTDAPVVGAILLERANPLAECETLELTFAAGAGE